MARLMVCDQAGRVTADVEVHDPLLHGPVRTPSYESAVRDYASWKAWRG